MKLDTFQIKWSCDHLKDKDGKDYILIIEATCAQLNVSENLINLPACVPTNSSALNLSWSVRLCAKWLLSHA